MCARVSLCCRLLLDPRWIGGCARAHVRRGSEVLQRQAQAVASSGQTEAFVAQGKQRVLVRQSAEACASTGRSEQAGRLAGRLCCPQQARLLLSHKKSSLLALVVKWPAMTAATTLCSSAVSVQQEQCKRSVEVVNCPPPSLPAPGTRTCAHLPTCQPNPAFQVE